MVYKDAECSLDYRTPHELLVAVQLSAQCTDARVNIVTKDLFKRYKSVYEFAGADEDELAAIIRPCGFYKNKAKNIIASSKDIVSRFGGEIPSTMEELTSLAGVGRKTANLIVGDVYGKESIVVDTHMIRISNRIGLVADKDPHRIEIALKKVVPPEEGSDFCHRIVLFGRDICSARKPLCHRCPMLDNCKRVGVK